MCSYYFRSFENIFNRKLIYIYILSQKIHKHIPKIINALKESRIAAMPLEKFRSWTASTSHAGALWVALALLSGTSYANASPPPAAQPSFSEAIEDNSFFIEEAYNQEARVVQHISNGLYFKKPQKEFDYTFTQEWPLFSPAHQISYTLPYSFLDSASGMGDAMIHYRYQLFYKQHWAAVSPRISVIFPTGDEQKALGDGVVGLQFNLPVSKRLSDPWIVHLNAGATLMPDVKGKTASGTEVRRNLVSYNTGASLIWLATPHFNLMLEAVTNFNSDIGDDGGVVRATETILSPGFRCAINVRSLQIVPGAGLPVRFSGGGRQAGAFLYLSFEHPF